MPTARINGFDMYYERHGDEGEPLVLVHGYTGDVSDWWLQLDEFAPTHRLLLLDHRGHGKSSAPADRSSYTIKQMADDVEALVAHVGFERYHLLGHSMGGAVSQEIALRSPGRLLSLTLEDTGPTFDIGKSEVVTKIFSERLRMAEEQGMTAVANLPGLPDPPHMPPGRRDRERARMIAMSPDGYIGAWGALTGWPGSRDHVHTIAVPTLVIYGELDAPMIVSGMEWLAKTIPGAQEVRVPEAAHCPQFERPDIFNPAVRAHLERNAAGAGK
jgi:2-succinyl-6-hydroxy-2,4-cyclohexadiene-1-carboxylate synthase